MQNSTTLTRPNLALVFQAVIVFFCLTGIATNVWMANTLYGKLNSFSYYTIQSNLLAAAALLLGMPYLQAGKAQPRPVVIFKSGALLWILVTGIVYNLLLANRWHPQGAMVYVNLSLHYATPLGMVLNWLLFERKGQYRLAYIGWWMSYPLLYLLVSWLRGGLTGFYPYWFLNPTAPYPEGAGSLPAMLGMVGIMVAGFLLGGVLIWLVDSLAGRRSPGGQTEPRTFPG